VNAGKEEQEESEDSYTEGMAFLIDEAYLPAILTVGPMTDEAFASFCEDHPDLSFEMTAEGELLVMPPAYSLTGIRNSKIGRQLEAWAETDGRGMVGDSSTGFVLPNGARRSPDASWTLSVRVQALDQASRERYWHLAPDFVIELRSDRLRVLREKMAEWLANGAQLGWLIDPERRAVEVYRPGLEPRILENVDSIEADEPIAGFTLDLARVWDPLA
jgi:Uma2 family endonuclease